MLLNESPYLRLFPAPASSQGFQCLDGTILAKLNGRRQKGESIPRIVGHRMAPQIQPGICFLKFVVLLYQPLSNIAGQAEKSIPICGIDDSVHAFSTGALHDPISDLIGQLLCFSIQLIPDITKLCELIKGLQGL